MSAGSVDVPSRHGDDKAVGETATHSASIEGTDLTFEVAEGERIHGAARRAGVWLPFECGWGSCGTCKVTVVDGSTELLFPDAPAVNPRDVRRGRVITCQSTATSDVVMKGARVESCAPAERPVRDLVGRLMAVEELAPAISRFRFQLLDAAGDPVLADYRPGQYAILETLAGVRRCLSFSSLPGSDVVEFIAKKYAGQGSSRLFDLAEGDLISVEMPYGAMWLRPGEHPVILVAGGTGISAILAMVEAMASDGGRPAVDRKVHVVYGAATPAELVCWDELAAHVQAIPGAVAHGAVLAPEPGWKGTTGLVTDALVVHTGHPQVRQESLRGGRHARSRLSRAPQNCRRGGAGSTDRRTHRRHRPNQDGVNVWQ